VSLPSALDRWEDVERRLRGRELAVFLDYDGTLSPIVERPEDAVLSAATRDALRRLAGRFPVTIVSGRGREDVADKVAIDSLVYAGSHGFDIAGPPTPTGGPIRHQVGEGVPQRIEEASARLEEALAGIPGARVEPKRFAVAVHFRQSPEEAVPRVEAAVDRVASALPGLRKTHGKKIFELRPDLEWDKGHALLWVLEALGLDRPGVAPLYVGDDVTDEDAFRELNRRFGDRALGVLVAEEPRASEARFRLRDPEEVRRFLERLAGLPEGDAER
jgi:trehalose-phosphatase